MERILEQSKIELAKLKNVQTNQSDSDCQEKWINADRERNAIKAEQLIICDTNKKLKNDNRRVIKAPIKLKRKLEHKENNARKIFKICTENDKIESVTKTPVTNKLIIKTETTCQGKRYKSDTKLINKCVKIHDNEKQIIAKIAAKFKT